MGLKDGERLWYEIRVRENCEKIPENLVIVQTIVSLETQGLEFRTSVEQTSCSEARTAYQTKWSQLKALEISFY